MSKSKAIYHFLNGRGQMASPGAQNSAGGPCITDMYENRYIYIRDERVHHYLYLYLFNHLNYLYPYL